MYKENETKMSVLLCELLAFVDNYVTRGRQFHRSPSQRFLGPGIVGPVGSYGYDLLVWANAGSGSNSLSEGLAHSIGDTVSTGASGLFVFPQDIVRIYPDVKMIIESSQLL